MTDDTPKNEETERTLLGQCMLDGAALLEATTTTLKADDFWRDDHGKLWELLQAMQSSGDPIDLITVAEAVDRRGRATGKQAMGGVSYVIGLTRDVPSTVNVRHYAENVVRDATRRRLLRDIDEVRGRASSGLDDPSELVENLQAALAASEDAAAPQKGWQSIGDLMASAVAHATDAHANPDKGGGLSTGFVGIDLQVANLHPGDLTVLAARPGMGKTALVLNIAENVARADGVVGVFSLEMSGLQLGMRTLASSSGISAKGMRTGRISEDELLEVTAAAGFLRDDIDGVYVDTQAGISVPQIRARCIRLQRKAGTLDLVVIDYLQLIKAHTPAGTSREQQVATMSRELKVLAKDLGVPVILLAQLSRKCEDRADKRPQLSDLRESGAIEQDADNVWFLYRPEYYEPDDPEYWGKAECNVAKSRHGGPGVVHLRFTAHLTLFETPCDVQSVVALD